MNKILLTLSFAFIAKFSCAQVFEVTGIVKDNKTKETLIGAGVTYANGKGTVTDINGEYKLKLSSGTYQISARFVGYEIITKKVVVLDKNIKLDFNTQQRNDLKEVEIIAGVAKNRETPVAYSTIDARQISEELGVRDLPNLLNSTPGVYATESGGGNGDSRISIRGFDQRNIAMLIDGIPFNDMENGAVFWSNWSGLGGAVQNIQVQRGLGASRLALPSVGGTMNIITKGILDKKAGSATINYGNNNNMQANLNYNSGMLGRGFGVTFAFNYQQSDGYVDNTPNNAFSYFAKFQRRFNRHIVTFTVNGTKQKHAQRTSQFNMGNVSADYALKNGFDKGLLDSIKKYKPYDFDRGLRYNKDWGYDTINNKTINGRVNFYSKPVIALSDYWTLRENINWTNLAYLSVGIGGGASPTGVPTDVKTGLQDYSAAYTLNQSIDASKNDNLKKSIAYLRSGINSHYWYGAISTLNINIDKSWAVQVGADYRGYNGIHFQTPFDLLGGDYTSDNSFRAAPQGIYNTSFGIRKLGYRLSRDYYSKINWIGGFGQLEYKTEKLSAFLNITNSYSFYQRFDNLLKKDLVLPDTTFYRALGYADTIVRGGNKYHINSAEARTSESVKKNFRNYSFKGGANYNINKNYNVFVNAGYLVLPPRFVNVFDNNNKLATGVGNQFVNSYEAGFGYKTTNFAGNINAYYTLWKNRPVDFLPTIQATDAQGNPVTLFYNINGVNELHKGIEVDVNYKIIKQLSVQAAVTISDWIYKDNGVYSILDEFGNFADSIPGTPFKEKSFSAKGVHVGDAAQNQFTATIRYMPIKGAYISLQGLYFAKNYSKFDPTTLNGVNSNRESWQIPAYSTFNLFAGYKYEFKNSHALSASAGVLNLFNQLYITDAQNNGTASQSYFAGQQTVGQYFQYDANSASVFFAQGLRFNFGLTYSF